MKSLIRSLLVVALATPAAAAAAHTEGCGMAILQDVDMAATLVPSPTVTTGRSRGVKPGVRDWWGYTTPGARLSKRYLVTVRLNDMVYTGEASGDGFWTFNPGSLVINEPIHACVVQDRLRLTRPNGKDYSTKIVRAVKQPAASPTADSE